jgi:hypothetical protein
MIPYLGHDLGEWYTVNEPTYDNQGEERRDCNRCTYHQTLPIAVLDHVPGPHATCTTDQICTRCNEVLVPAYGHTPGAAATCTTSQLCTTCNAVLASPLGHNFSATFITDALVYRKQNNWTKCP